MFDWFEVASLAVLLQGAQSLLALELYEVLEVGRSVLALLQLAGNIYGTGQFVPRLQVGWEGRLVWVVERSYEHACLCHVSLSHRFIIILIKR